jgi:hypothetical protein
MLERVAHVRTNIPRNLILRCFKRKTIKAKIVALFYFVLSGKMQSL